MRTHRVWWAALTSCATVAMYAGLSVGPAGAVTAAGTSWDTTSELGGPGTTLNNTITTTTDDGEVRLSDQTQAFPFLWVAQSQRGTIAKIDTVTGQILGEYRSAPQDAANGYPNPSRTTVTKDGSVWSGNRNLAAVVHVGVAETGQCVDRNHNGTIDTSTGYGDVRAWPTGDASHALDECILDYVPTYGGDARHLSVDAQGFIWVGNFTEPGGWVGAHRFNKIDPATGVIVRTEDVPCGGYGGLIDRNGVIWSATSSYWQVLRWDPAAATVPGSNPRCISVPSYGLAEDSAGNIWTSNYAGDTDVRRIAPDGNTIDVFPTHRPLPYAQGLAVSRDSSGTDHIWVSSSLSGGANVISHLLGDGTWIGNVTGAGAGSTGVSVDAAGKVWTANIESSDATRIDPSSGPMSVTPGHTDVHVGAFDKTVPFPASGGMPPGDPYNYSDMTGSSLKGAPDSGTWAAVYDSGTADAEWGTLSWTAEVPDGAGLTVTVAASNDAGSFGPAVTADNGTPFTATGRYVRVTVVMDRAPGAGASGSPVLEDIMLLPANRPPVADAGSDQAVSEGDEVTLDATASSDPDGDPVTYDWVLLPGYSGPAVTLVDADTAQPTFGTTDDGVYTFRVTVTDDDAATDADEVTVTVSNVAPTITGLTAPVDPVPVDQLIALSADFTDPGTADTHTATFALDGSSVTGSVSETAGSGTATGSTTVAAAGVYTVKATVTDDDGGSDTETAAVPVVVYDPSAGFVTGGGWIDAPAGSYPADPALDGKASFGFVSRYAKGATTPTGNTEFYFHAAGLRMKSTSYSWLVVAGARAQYKGSATVNGVGGYGFLLTAVDGQVTGGGGVDRLRMKIWDDGGTVVFDNQVGAADSATPATALAGGSVVIHK